MKSPPRSSGRDSEAEAIEHLIGLQGGQKLKEKISRYAKVSFLCRNEICPASQPSGVGPKDDNFGYGLSGDSKESS